MRSRTKLHPKTRPHLTNLGRVLRLFRAVNGLGLRGLGAETGLSTATMMRIEMGHGMDATTLLKMMAWLMSEVREVRKPRKRRAAK